MQNIIPNLCNEISLRKSCVFGDPDLSLVLTFFYSGPTDNHILLENYYQEEV